MRLTKLTHACVRLERAGGVLVVDPGSFSEPTATDGADAVLITHEHADHLDPAKLTSAAAARPGLTVYAHPDVVPQLAEVGATVRPVVPGEELAAAGFRVRVGGGQHAVIHPDIPRIANVGYLVEADGTTVYHPGDALDPADLPDGAAVDTLLLPLHAPWARLGEAVDYLRAVDPRRAYAVHDHLLSPAGATVYGNVLGRLVGDRYQRLDPGTTVEL